MKNIKAFFPYVSYIIMFCIGLSSCKKDEQQSTRIESVWSHEIKIESKEIHSAYFNNWIRLHGQGLSGLKKIYFNGADIPFSPIHVTDNDIIVKIPRIAIGSAVEDKEQLNTIRVITEGGQAEYSNFIFKDPDKIPSLNSVSNTMPYAGEEISISGLNLENTTKAYFPNNVEADIIEVSDKLVRLVTPTNIDRNVSGAIKLVVDGDEFSTPPYIFYQNGIFFKTFTEGDRTGLAANSSIKIISTPSEIAAATGMAVNPEAVLAIPDVRKNIAVVSNGTWTGFYRFWASAMFQSVVDNSSNNISASTSLQDLAIQFEVYMTQPWESGYISIAINKDAGGSGTSAYRCNVYGGTADNPILFNGKWITVTVPFSKFKNLALGSLGDYIATLQSNKYQSLIGFSNSNPDNDGHTPSAINNFQMFIANMRIVPTK